MDEDFTFRVYSPAGDPRLTVHLTRDVLEAQEHLAPVLESIRTALAASPLGQKLLIAVEDSDPVAMTLNAGGAGTGMAHLARGQAELVLIAAADSSAAPDASALRLLRAKLSELHPGVQWDAAFDWLSGCAPPSAVAAYLRGGPNVGLDSVAMCVAAAFLDSPGAGSSCR